MVDTNLRGGHMYNPAFNLHCKTNISQRETSWEALEEEGSQWQSQKASELKGPHRS